MSKIGKFSFLGVQGIFVYTVMLLVTGNLLEDDAVGSCVQHCYYTIDLILSNDPMIHQIFSLNFPEEGVNQATLLISAILKTLLGVSTVLLICHVLLVIGTYLQMTFLLIPWVAINCFLCLIIFHSTLFFAFYFSGSTFHNISMDNILLAMVLYSAYSTYYKLLTIQAGTKHICIFSC